MKKGWRDNLKNKHICSVMCLLRILCCSPVSVLVARAHLGVHTAAGGEGSSTCFPLPGGWTDIKANMQWCSLPREERCLLYSSAAPLAALWEHVQPEDWTPWCFISKLRQLDGRAAPDLSLLSSSPSISSSQKVAQRPRWGEFLHKLYLSQIPQQLTQR